MKKKQTIILSVNGLLAEVLLQALRHPNWEELTANVKEALEYDPGHKIEEALEYLENEVYNQVTWSQF